MNIDLRIIWKALECYREDCIPEEEENPAYDQEWKDICEQMDNIKSLIKTKGETK